MVETDLNIASALRSLITSFEPKNEDVEKKCKFWIPLKDSPTYQVGHSLHESRKRLQKRVSRLGAGKVSDFEELYLKCKAELGDQFLGQFLDLAVQTSSDSRHTSSVSSRLSISLPQPSPAAQGHAPAGPLPPMPRANAPVPDSVASSSGVSSAVNTEIRHSDDDISHSTTSSQRTVSNEPPSSRSSNTDRPMLTARNIVDPDSWDRTESLIISDLLYVLNGANGKYIRKNEKLTGYIIDKALSVHPCQEHQIRGILECASLYDNIRGVCSNEKERGLRGSIASQFITALSDQMSEHNRLLACLATEVQHAVPKLRLVRISEWASGAKCRLSCQNKLAECCKVLKGGELLTELYKHAIVTHTKEKTLIWSLLGESCKPLISHLSRWIGLGLIQDPYGEFFIESSGNVADEDVWISKFRIKPQMVPAFLNQKQCEKILLAGKSRFFMRTQCMQEWVDEKIGLVQDRVTDMDPQILFDPFKTALFDDLILLCCNEISVSLIDLLKTKFKLVENLKVLNQYILLNNGEFAYTLIEHVSGLLGQPAENVVVSEWSSALEKSLGLTAFVQQNEQALINKIHVQKLEPSPGENGWQVFMLKYRVDPPLTVIVDGDCQLQYSRIFSFILRLKRLVFLVSETKKLHRFTSTVSNKYPELLTTLRQFDLLSSEMYHFVREMHSNIVGEVLSCAWTKLERELSSAVDLDAVRRCVHAYLNNILDECLLNDKNDDQTGNLQQEMRGILNTVLDMMHTHQRWLAEIDAAMQIEHEFDMEQKRQERMGRSADSENMCQARHSKRQQFIDSTLAHYPVKFTQLTTQFRALLQSLLIHLASSSNERLTGLCLRLDMSHFYRGRDPALLMSLSHRRQSLITGRSKLPGMPQSFAPSSIPEEVFTPVRKEEE